MGSIGMAAKFKAAPAPSYKISKAALNMLTVQYALALEDEGFTVVAISPGVSNPEQPFVHHTLIGITVGEDRLGR